MAQKKPEANAGANAPIPGTPEPNTARLVAAAIAATADDFGVVTPAGVVEAAKNKTSILHRYFTWDDAEAADKHRLAQARELIRRIEYIVVETDRRTVTAVEYVHRPGSQRQGYIPLTMAMANRNLARDVLREEMARVEGAIGRARRVAAALGLEASLESMLADVARILDAVAA